MYLCVREGGRIGNRCFWFAEWEHKSKFIEDGAKYQQT